MLRLTNALASLYSIVHHYTLFYAPLRVVTNWATSLMCAMEERKWQTLTDMDVAALACWASGNASFYAFTRNVTIASDLLGGGKYGLLVTDIQDLASADVRMDRGYGEAVRAWVTNHSPFNADGSASSDCSRRRVTALRLFFGEVVPEDNRARLMGLLDK